MTILMHEPTDELFLGVMHPGAALFSDYFNIEMAAAEHANYRHELEKAGARVLTVREILLQGTLDEKGNAIPGKDLDDLRELASRFLVYNTDNIPEAAGEQEIYRRQILERANPLDLVRIIMLRPEIVLSQTESNTGLSARYIQKPIMNIFFMRDQMISTLKGIILGRMNSPQRDGESGIVEFCLRKTGMPPLWAVSGGGAYLEGGDFLPVGRNAFIGCGLRTTHEAIMQLMERDLLGCDKLIVVKDRWLEQEQMHLDTYFNVIDHDLATLSENRLRAQQGNPQYLTADIYVREEGGYRLSDESVDFVGYITSVLGMSVIPIARGDELNYANNYLTVAPRRIMAVAGQSQELQDELRSYGVQATWIPLTNLIKGYGAAHCMTQVIGPDELL